jgi:hypothetical protein
MQNVFSCLLSKHISYSINERQGRNSCSNNLVIHSTQEGNEKTLDPQVPEPAETVKYDVYVSMCVGLYSGDERLFRNYCCVGAGCLRMVGSAD